MFSRLCRSALGANAIAGTVSQHWLSTCWHFSLGCHHPQWPGYVATAGDETSLLAGGTQAGSGFPQPQPPTSRAPGDLRCITPLGDWQHLLSCPSWRAETSCFMQRSSWAEGLFLLAGKGPDHGGKHAAPTPVGQDVWHLTRAGWVASCSHVPSQQLYRTMHGPHTHVPHCQLQVAQVDPCSSQRPQNGLST